MDRRPVPEDKRRRLEAVIRVLDMVTYIAIIAGGVYAVAFTPNTVQVELAGWEWLINIWGALLLLGGGIGFTGRLTRYWIFEMPATLAAVFGIAIYFVVLGTTSFSSITATVAAALAFVAMVAMVRRYVELQIFSSDPDNDDFKTRLAEMIRRRTLDAVPHDR